MLFMKYFMLIWFVYRVLLECPSVAENIKKLKIKDLNIVAEYRLHSFAINFLLTKG